jgi:hypothetical protein
MRPAQLLLVGLLAFNTGCTFHSNQFASARSFVLASWFASVNQVEQGSWIAQYGLLRQAVELSRDGDLMVFSGHSDTRIVVRGKAVQSFSGFGLLRPVSLAGESGKFRFGKGRGAHYCYEWAEESVDYGVLWTQTCDGGFSYQNSVLFDNEGRILSLSQVVDASGSRLKLIRKGPM